MLNVTSVATDTFANTVSAMPIGIYLLSFINYFSLSSLYVLLNFPIP